MRFPMKLQYYIRKSVFPKYYIIHNFNSYVFNANKHNLSTISLKMFALSFFIKIPFVHGKFKNSLYCMATVPLLYAN